MLLLKKTAPFLAGLLTLAYLIFYIYSGYAELFQNQIDNQSITALSNAILQRPADCSVTSLAGIPIDKASTTTIRSCTMDTINEAEQLVLDGILRRYALELSPTSNTSSKIADKLESHYPPEKNCLKMGRILVQHCPNALSRISDKDQKHFLQSLGPTPSATSP